MADTQQILGWMTELQTISQRYVWMLTIDISIINSQMLHCYPPTLFSVYIEKSSMKR